jgi:hypothetical protein
MKDASYVAAASPLRTVRRRSRSAAHREGRLRGEDSARRACADDLHERHPLGHALSFEHRDRVRATILKLSPSVPLGRAAARRRLAAALLAFIADWAPDVGQRFRWANHAVRQNGTDARGRTMAANLPLTDFERALRRLEGLTHGEIAELVTAQIVDKDGEDFAVVTEALSLETLRLLSARALAAAHSHRRPTLTWLAPGCR